MKPCRQCGHSLPLVGRGLCRTCLNEIRLQEARRRQSNDPVRFWADNAIRQSKQRAKARGIPFALTILDLQNKVTGQEELCWYCQRKMRFIASGRQVDDSPSVDQVDPGGGYTEGNTVVCCWRCNRIKSDATSAELELLADGVRRWKHDQGRARADAAARDLGVRRGGPRGPHLGSRGGEPGDGGSG